MATQNLPATERNPEILKLLQERAANPEAHPDCSLMEIINYTPYDGDTKHMWDKNNPDEVEMAKTMFDKFTKEKKYVAFATDKKGDQGEQMKEFDANAERIIFVPPMRGG